MIKPLTLGAVLYDPKVSVIWEIICQFFEKSGVPMDVVYFTNYEKQVDALVGGLLDVAWNSPLAWLDTDRRGAGRFRAVAMRDTDRNRCSHFIVKRGNGVENVEQLRGRTLAVGALDSPQATLIPIEVLSQHGLDAGKDYKVERFDVLVGKHGDHIGGELDAFKALQRDKAAASTMLDLNWQTWTSDGTINANEYAILSTTGTFDHCVFAWKRELPEPVHDRWLEVLFSMSYDNPKHREMMDMEGLKAWVLGRTTGFELLTRAVEHQHFFSRS
jgi:phosphonate transport system substrate-binding protein